MNKKKIAIISVAAVILVIIGAFLFKSVGDIGRRSMSSIATANYDDGWSGGSSAKAVAPEMNSYVMADAEIAEETNAYTAASGIEVDEDAIKSGEKLVYDASIDLQTKNYTEHKKAILDVIKENDAIIESTNERNRNSSYDSGMIISWTIRVPYKNFNTVYDKITSSENGWSVLSATANVSNFTDTYSMNQSYIESYQTEKETLLGLLENAKKMSDILEINDRLASINSELKYYTDSNKSIDKQVEYSSITISLSEVVKYSSEKIQFKTRFGEAVHDAWFIFVSFFASIALFLTRFSLFIALGLVIGVIVYLVRKNKKKARQVLKMKDATVSIEQEDTKEASKTK